MRVGKSTKEKNRRIHAVLTGLLAAYLGLTTIFSSVSVLADEPAAESVAEEGDMPSDRITADLAEPDDLHRIGYDVVYVIDNSSSVWDRQAIRDQAFKNITNLAVGADIQIGGIYFAGNPYSTIAFRSMENQSESEEILSFLNMHSEKAEENYKGINARDSGNTMTNMGKGLEFAKKLFEESDPSRKRVVVLFSDGVNEVNPGDGDADQLTKDMAQDLKNMNTDIYCVYLDMESKETENQDEGFLKDLVNYFSDDADYVPERYEKVKATNISELYSSFIDVFYKMQGNMKYRELLLDSSGKDKFYVPSLGIHKVRVFLQGDFNDEPAILPSENAEEVSHWNDGNALFYDYSNKGPGWWNIQVQSNQVEEVEGTITYYPNLLVLPEIVEAKDEKAELKIHFFDESRKEILIDDTAEVTAQIHVLKEDGSEHILTPDVQIHKGVAVSDLFDVSENGDYSCTLNVTYDKYVNLTYSDKYLMKIENISPVITEEHSSKGIYIITGLCLVIAAAAILLYCIRKRNNRFGQLQKLKAEFDQSYKNFIQISSRCKEINFTDWAETFEQILRGDSDGTEGLIKMSSHLSGDLIEKLGLSEFLKDGFIQNVLAVGKKTSAEVTGLDKKMEKLKLDADSSCSGKNDLNNSIRLMDRFCKDANKLNTDIENALSTLQYEDEKLKTLRYKISSLSQEVSRLMKKANQ